MKELNNKDFSKIYTSLKMRNAVAFATGCFDANCNFKYYQAINYPLKYSVTKQQIFLAKEERKRDEKVIFETNKNHLLFRGMGSSVFFKDGNEGNYRFRTEFYNSKGRRFFVEFGYKGNEEKLWCSHSIDREQAVLLGAESWKADYYKNLNRKDLGECTYSNILNIVNETFDCNFEKVIIDNYTIGFDYRGVFCRSPKFSYKKVRNDAANKDLKTLQNCGFLAVSRTKKGALTLRLEKDIYSVSDTNCNLLYKGRSKQKVKRILMNSYIIQES